jgi:hypothetical protein
MIERDLGKLESVHGIAPAFLQRAAIIVVVSFIFFVAMLIAFSIRQNIGYFLLGTAFLIVQLFTLFGWVIQKRTELKLFENGFTYKKQTCNWDEIESMSVRDGSSLFSAGKTGCEIKKTNGEKIVLSEAIHDINGVVQRISAEIARRRE